MRELPNWKLYKECPKCGTWAFGRFDSFCPRCGTELPDKDGWLADISEYAKTLLIDFLQSKREMALNVAFEEVPYYATENISNNGNVFFNTSATRHALAENWNQVEIALDDWRERNGGDYHWRNIECLHVFCVIQHAEIAWRKVEHDTGADHLSEEELEDAVSILKQTH
jgi:hypothetical protein